MSPSPLSAFLMQQISQATWAFAEPSSRRSLPDSNVLLYVASFTNVYRTVAPCTVLWRETSLSAIKTITFDRSLQAHHMGNLMCKEQKVIYLKPEARASELGVLTLLIKSPKSQLTSAGSLLDEEWGQFSFEPTDSLLFKELEHLRTWESGASSTTHFRGEFISTCSIYSEGCDRDEAVEIDTSVACRDMGFKTATTERASIDKAVVWEHMCSDKARWLPNLSRFEDWLTYCTPGPSGRKQKHIELWVVTDVFYHIGDTCIQANGRMDAHMGAMAAHTNGCVTTAKETRQRARFEMREDCEVHEKRRPFAFKAIRLWYDIRSGELMKTTSRLPKRPQRVIC
ncbi:hypothetical protein KP509_34G053000 [Ceratopteris richardii]|uniref:Uncharacterized protein n=1 Tax=Ceratopteris richardii TaxID=49495 RepID=A0A8T2QM96_CERRI|nr:hypothetical protein KP509_34G053000 [Ceratopteris richardii]